MTIVQGNTYDYPIRILLNGLVMRDSDVSAIEFYFGDVRKTYPEDATFKDDCFYVHLTQEDTFAIKDFSTFEGRIKFVSGKVRHTPKLNIRLITVKSREVL